MSEANKYDPATDQDVHPSGTEADRPKDTGLATEPGLDNPDVKDLATWAAVKSTRSSKELSPDSVFGKRD